MLMIVDFSKFLKFKQNYLTTEPNKKTYQSIRDCDQRFDSKYNQPTSQLT